MNHIKQAHQNRARTLAQQLLAEYKATGRKLNTHETRVLTKPYHDEAILLGYTHVEFTYLVGQLNGTVRVREND